MYILKVSRNCYLGKATYLDQSVGFEEVSSPHEAHRFESKLELVVAIGNIVLGTVPFMGKVLDIDDSLLYEVQEGKTLRETKYLAIEGCSYIS